MMNHRNKDYGIIPNHRDWRRSFLDIA